MDVMLCTASIFNLCAISVDRFEFPIILILHSIAFPEEREKLLWEAFSQERMRME